MNAPFVVAQAITTGQGASPQIVKLTKPANGQAISLTLDANTRLDFSGIASEQITLVRVGNQLVILFDNQATITVGPFFNLSGTPLDGIHVDLGNNRIVDGQEFAGLFPISTDTNILPASGNAGGSGDGFGAGGPHVDALGSGNPLDLLGNEDGPGITFSINEILGRDNDNETGPVEPGPTAFSQTIGMDEDGDAFVPLPNLPGRLPDGPGDDPTAPLTFFGGPGISGFPAPLAPAFYDFGPDGPAAVNPIVYDTAALDALLLTSFGQLITWRQFGNDLVGSVSLEGGDVIRLTILDLQTGDYRVDLYRALDHAAPTDGVAFENELPIPINFTLTDGNGTTAGGTLTVSVDDDSPDPCNPLLGNVEETGVVQATVDLDLAWGADYINTTQGPIDRSIAFANNTTPSANVAASDINGDPLPALTSNGVPVLYTILGPAVQGDPVYLVAYTDPKSVPTSQNDPGVVFWVSLSDQALGIAVFELLGPLDHSAPPMLSGVILPNGLPEYLHAMDLTFSFNAFDSDGDGVTGTFTIRVDAAGDVYVCGCNYVTIDYSTLPGGVFINLADSDSTAWGQTVAANTATDLDGVSPKVIGRDNVDGVGHAIGTDEADVIIGGDEDNVLEGRGGADLIRGGRGADVIDGGDGADEIYGGRGDDAILGGGGADTIYGGRGWDEIHGGAGADWISGGADSDFLTGDGGDDTIRGGAGADLIWGGAGEDDIRGGRGADEIYGDAGNDTIRGGRGADYIEGNGGDDNIRGGRGDDEIYGGAGDDTIRGGLGDDYIEGNGDDDTIIYNVGGGHDIVFGGAGDDLQEIYGTGDSETFNVNRISLGGDNFVGINIQDGIAFPAPATSGNFEVATRVEDIYIDTGAGPDAVVVTGSLGGTTLATSTITIDGGSDDATDIVDAADLTSNHGIVFNGGGGDDYFFLSGADGVDTFDGGAGIDTALYSCLASDATFGFDGTHWTITVNGVTDTIIGVEAVEFADESFLLVDHYGQDVGGFQTIQDAVDYSCGCQTVLIAPGIYDENVTIENNDVSLMGLEPTRTTIITGQITISGVLDGDITLTNLAINAAGENYGVFANASSTAFGGEITLDNVLVANAGRNGFAYIRDGNGSIPTLADTIGAIAILNSDFSGNGTSVGATRGDILIYGFNGDLTIEDVTIGNPGASADKAIQVRGIQDGADLVNVGPYDSFGDVSITNLTITGSYSQDLVAFYNIAEFASFVATNVALNANAPWGLFNLDGVGGDVDLSGVTGANGAGPFIATMQGLASDDVFTGTDGNDMFVGRGGTDIFDGLGGNDTFYYFLAAGGSALAHGGAGADVMNVTGSNAAETFNVNLINYFGVDHLGINIVAGNDAVAVVTAFAANSEVVTRDVEDIVIDTGAGADVVVLEGTLGGNGLATITVDGGTGTDADIVDARGLTSNHGIVFSGRGGGDVFYSSAALGNDTFIGGDGTDTIDFSGVGANVAIDLAVAVGQDTNFGTDTVIFVENVVGGSGNDDISGSSAANVLDGGAGADTLKGRGGNDTLLGGAGVDEILYELGDGVDFVDGGDIDDGAGDKLTVGSGAGNPDNDYIRIASDLDADGNLDIDFDANSNVEVPADGIELDVVNVERVLLFSGDGNDNVVISGDVAAAGVESIFVFAGDGNDTVTLAASTGTPVDVSVDGGDGNDTLDASAREFRPAIGQDFLVSTSNANIQFNPQITTLANGGFAVTWQSADSGTNDIRGQVFAADGTPVDGSDFAVSTENANGQINPQITALANGGFAVTWQSGDTDSGNIRGQVFAADGTPIDGSDFAVSTANANNQGEPQITALANGGFAVTWASSDNGTNFDIRGQVFAADGTPIAGSDFPVSTANADNQLRPQITALANGGFVVTWHSFDNGANDDIRGQVFAADGTPIGGSDFLVSTANTFNQQNPQLTALPNGGFVVTWRSTDNGADDDIRGQVFAADGTPIDGSDFLVSTANANNQITPQITALPDGGFVVTWQTGTTSDYDIRGRVFAADGTPINGSDFAVSTENANFQVNPQITALASGGFVVTWQTGTTSNTDIRGQVFAADGTPIGGSDFLVSTTNASEQSFPQITALPDGGFAVTWASRDNGTNHDIRGRVFDAFGVESAITFDGGAGDDVFRSGAGNDIFTGGGDDDTAYYRIGDGRDIVDGGTGDDLQNITGSSVAETFNVNLITLSGVDHVGINIEGGNGASSAVLASDTNYEVATVGVEDIFIDTGAGSDTVIITGSLNGTGLAQSTITVDTGAGNDTLDLTNRDSAHRVVVDGGSGTDTVIYDFTRASVTSVTEIYAADGVTVIGAAITHNIGGQSVTDEFTNFETFTFTDGTLDLATVFNQAPDAVDDALSTLVQYDFTGTVTGQDEFVPWSSTYTFTLMVDASTRVATSFGYEIPLVASATLNLPYFSPDVLDIAIPIRLGYNTTTNRVFFAATGTGHEDAYTITLTEPQEGIFLTQPTFGPLTGTAAQFNFIGLRDIIGSALPPHIVFTGGTVTAEVAASNGVKTEDTPFTIAVSSLIGNDSDPDGDPITFVSVQGAVGGSVSLSGGYITFTPTADYFGAASFTYTIRDSFGLTDTATASFNINSVNDAPFLDLDGNDSTISGNEYITTATTGGPGVRIVDTDMILSDVDDTHLEGLTVSISNPKLGDLLTTNPALIPIGISFNAGASTPGNLVFTGHATPADYETLLRNITFQTTSGDTTLRFLSVSVADGDSGFGVTSLVAINSPPAITSVQNGNVTEDAGVSATGPNLVFNGGFDSYSLVFGSLPGHIATLPGWTLQGTPFQADFDDFVSSTASLQINGLSNVSQNITTVAGQRYELSFWHDGPTSQTTQVTFDGNVLISATPPAANSPFLLYTVEFDGTGGAATLRFTQPGFGSSNLDNVAVRLLAPPAQQTDSGTIAFTDVNVTNLHSASYVAQGGGAGYVGTFSLGAVDQNGKSVGWNFVADNSALQFLSANQTVTQIYAVTVTDNHGASTTQNVSVLLHGVNDAPVITSNNGNALAVNAAENQTSVTTVVASDVDLGTTLTWTLSGTDAALFNISNAGVITFKNAPDYEAPSDSGANNVYDLIANVSDGTLSDTQAVTVTVTGANDAPVITISSLIIMAENGTFVTDANAIDDDAGQTLTYSLLNGFGNNNLFQIDASTGVLSFIAAPDFETPLGLGGNTYFLTAQVSDGIATNSQTLLVVVTNVNEAPVITAPNGGNPHALNVAENTTAVTTIVAADPEGATLAYTLSGADAGLFQINAGGALSFITAPNFEAPADTGGNNVYNVTVQVSDGTLTDTQAVSVTVTDVNDAPLITISPLIMMAENGTFVTDANAIDDDAGQTLTYSLLNGFGNNNLFQIDASTGVLSFIAAPDFETPLGIAGNSYFLTAQVSDGIATNSQTLLVVVTNVNEAPVITSNNGDPLAVSAAENQTLVATIVANDVDPGASLTWTLAGTDAALFNISTAGVVTFKNAPDFDSPADSGNNNVYDLIAQVSDGTLTDTQAVTVTVTDVNYAPTDIQLSNASVSEIAGGAIVGVLSTTDVDSGQHGYTVNDSRFEVVNGQLKLKDNAQLDYETEQSVNVTITTTDAGGASFAKQFAIAVSNVDEPNLATVSEGGLAAGPQIRVVNLGFSPSDTETVAFTVNHPIGPTLTSDGVPLVYAVTSGTQAQLTAYKQGETVGQPVFTVTLSRFGHYTLGLYQNIDQIGDTTTLQFAAVREYFGTLTPMTLTVDIHDGVPSAQNDTAQVVTGSETIINVLANDGFGADGAHATTRIVNLAATHGTAEVTSDYKIRFVADADYTGPATVTYSIVDGDGDVSAPATVAVTVKPVNHAPTDIALSSASVDENTAGAVIGTLSTIDVDGWDSHTYAVNDNRFEVVNGELKLKSGQALDFEQGSPVNVTVTTTDAEGVSFAKQFAIAVGDVNETPTDIVWNAQMPSAGDSFPAAGAVIANLAAVDPDVNDTFAYQLLAGSSPDFTISQGGVVTRTGSAMDDDQAYTLNARVTDAAGATFDKTFEIHTGSGNADVMLLATPAGDDVLYAREGNDRLYAGGGNDTLFGQNGNDRLLADQAHVVTASVLNGVNGSSTPNQFVFAFDMAAATGESIREIRIDLPADARFLGAGFAFGSGSSGLGAADVINVNSQPQGSGSLVLRFADGVFVEGDVLSFGVDTVGTVEVGSNLVGKNFSVVFSDGTTLSSTYGAGDGGLAALRTAVDSLAGAGDDVLIGGAGNDTLVGGGGADTYRFGETGAADKDTILDYNFAQGDKLDLSALLDAAYGAGNNADADFVKLTSSGGNTTVQVDVNGNQGGAPNWQDVAVLQGYTGNVRAVFENVEHTLAA